MNKIKRILCIVFMLVIVLIIVICMLIKDLENKDTEKENEDFSNYGGDVKPKEYNNGFDDVNDSRIFFSVVDAVKKYEKICRVNTEIDYSNEYFDEDEYLDNIKSEQLRNKAIYDLLDKEYIKREAITVDNVSKVMFDIDSDTIILPKRMICKYGNNCNSFIYETYFIKGNIIENKCFVVRVSNKNSTFSLEFINEEYEDLSNIEISINDNTIENTGYNEFEIKNVKTEEVAKSYMDNYKQLLIIQPSIIYDNYMDTNYREKRYGSLDEFEEYVKENMDGFKKSQVVKYTTNSIEGGKIQYVCMDQFGNYYIFDESSTMQYTIQLDTYTIPTEKFKTEYDKAESEKKVQMNIDKFIQMVNRHDYKTSYNCIADGFKNNYFDIQDKFENYIKNAFFEYNNFEFENIEQKGNNLYTCTVTLTDLTGNSKDTKKITIIMQLNDNYDFKMSFSV